MKIDNGVEDDESEGSSDEGAESSDLSRITELRLVPTDPNQGTSFLSIIFHLGEIPSATLALEDKSSLCMFSVDSGYSIPNLL